MRVDIAITNILIIMGIMADMAMVITHITLPLGSVTDIGIMAVIGEVILLMGGIMAVVMDGMVEAIMAAVSALDTVDKKIFVDEINVRISRNQGFWKRLNGYAELYITAPIPAKGLVYS